MSKKYRLNQQDLEKIGKGALIAMGGALIFYAQKTVVNIDFGIYSPLAIALASVLINFANKLLTGEGEQK